ncbi:hypothetical protein [Pararhizobium sp. LjRoot238]|uniref:hypothetical protein n=1 Tax=Pararhizobium sp. LjRoot238 TaxID=3342293 RepID=UPI003ECD9D0D
MAIIIGILGILQMLGGVLAFLAAQSAIHEILGAVGFGLGTLCMGQAVIITRLIAPKASEPFIRTSSNKIINPKDEPAGGLDTSRISLP